MARAVACMSRQSSGAIKQTQSLSVGSFEKTVQSQSQLVPRKSRRILIGGVAIE
jgi:hypothetical protein